MKLTTQTLRSGLLLAGFLQLGLFSCPAHADQFDDMRNKWTARASSAQPIDPNDPDLQSQADTGNSNAQLYWTTMDTCDGRSALWPDLPVGTVSANVTSSFVRLSALYGAYTSPSSPYYQNADVLAAVKSGLDWMLAHVYSLNTTGYDNWWDWQIGAPQVLNGILINMYPLLTQTTIDNGVAAIDHFMPDPTRRLNMDGTLSSTIEAGANRLDKAFVSVLRGVVGKSSASITAGANAISEALQYVTTGDGFYADGSFVQHTHEPYVGGYGTVLVSDIAKLYYLLNDSSWAVTDPSYLNPYAWAMQSFRPYLYNGAMMDNNRGRQISRQFVPDHVAGRGTIGALAELTQVLPANEAAQLKAVLKGLIQRDTSFGSSYFAPVQTGTPGVMQGMSTFNMALLKGILNDPSVTPAAETSETRYYPASDRALQRRDGYAFALSLFSPTRMSAFEYGNGENLRGWWTGMGMTALYNGDLTQYGGNYWATVDMLRLAGTTSDHSGSGTPVAWKFYNNTKNTVGGAELNTQFATVGMDFSTANVTGTSLSGKKAWFLFGDRVVAAGAGISSSSGATVETIAENRALNANGDNALTVNGALQPAATGWSDTIAGTGWAHLVGNATGADIGYVFPDLPALSALRETRSGAWKDVNTGGTSTAVSANYLSLALNHGVNPSNAAYTYIVLPNRSAQEVSSFAAANPISVLERSTAATAVRDTQQGLTGAVFWNDAAKTVNANGQPYLSSDKKAVVMLQQQGTDVQLAVADPTQTNTGDIHLELNRTGVAVVSVDPAITVTQLSPTIKMTVAVNGARGASRTAHFTLSNTMTLYPSADAFVRDGTYASSNYGATTSLTVKEDGTGYRRKSLLKFDLSSVSGTISSATLKLTPTSVGTPSGITHRIYQSASDSWLEKGITWNGAPANGSLLGSWSVPAANTPVQVDLSSAASAVMSGSKLLALEVEADANYGSAASVDYASKENGNVNFRPTLVITYQ